MPRLHQEMGGADTWYQTISVLNVMVTNNTTRGVVFRIYADGCILIFIQMLPFVYKHVGEMRKS